jgi:hypothetical protein
MSLRTSTPSVVVCVVVHCGRKKKEKIKSAIAEYAVLAKRDFQEEYIPVVGRAVSLLESDGTSMPAYRDTGRHALIS